MNNLISKLESSSRQYDVGLVSRAYNFANDAHQGQKRKSGEDYIMHPVAVATILYELGLDSVTICAALLHDVAEDTPHGIDEIRRLFGDEIAELVDGVTKLNQLYTSDKALDAQAENVRKMFVAMARDIRVIIIKLADRLHNMRTIYVMTPQKQLEKSRETMEIYAPIANRLGVRRIKDELEDLSFRLLDPYAYKEIEENLKLRRDVKDDYADYIKDKITACLEKHNLNCRVDCRVKTPASIYHKVYQKGKAFDEVYDVYAIRVITETVAECYTVFGILSEMWKPIPNRFKDYIQNPKSNMYQSLHNTYIAREGIPFEVQIRTFEMHQIAEYGIAAHWKYKAGISKDTMEERIGWVRQILENQTEAVDGTELVDAIKTDIASDEILALTPGGDVKSLPEGATVIDFAYTVHSGVGNRMVGAKIDGKIVPLTTKVKTGQVIEILTGKEERPNRDWLNIVKTSEARSKIRGWFKKERVEENIQSGKELVANEFARNRIVLPPEKLSEFIGDIARRQHFNTIDELYAGIGYGGLILSKIMPRIKDDYIKLIKENDQLDPAEAVRLRRPNADGIIVEGIDNCDVKISRCCKPLPGDDIIGFVTRGHGVSVHKRECPNVISAIANPENAGRWIKTSWAKSAAKGYTSAIEIIIDGNPLTLSRITANLASFRIPVHEIAMRPLKNSNSVVSSSFTIEDKEQLDKIIAKIEKLKGVISVERQ